MFSSYINANCKKQLQQKTRFTITFLLIILLLNGCEKSDHPSNPATIQLFNALDDGEGLFTNLSGQHPIQYNTSLRVGNKAYYLNSNLLTIEQFPQPLAFYTFTDTLPKDLPVLSLNLDLDKSGIYSMFIYGTKRAAGYLMNKDMIPAINRIDSTTHFRIVNLSEQQELSVNLKGQAHKSFINKIAFKELSPFIELPADKSVASFEFEFRDYATGDLISSFEGYNTFNSSASNLFYARSNSLVFVGKKNGTGTNQQKVVLMNHR